MASTRTKDNLLNAVILVVKRGLSIVCFRHEAKCEKEKPVQAEKTPIYEVVGNSFVCIKCKKEFSHKPAVFKHINKGRCEK